MTREPDQPELPNPKYKGCVVLHFFSSLGWVELLENRKRRLVCGHFFFGWDLVTTLCCVTFFF